MKDTNRILILYKYDIYNHYTSKGIYRLLDTNLPYFDMHLNWFIQILYNTYNSNIKSYYYMIFENKFFNELIKIKLEKVFFSFQKFKNALHRFVHILRIRYSKKQNEKNISYDKFKNNHIKLYENGYVYRFDYYEIYKIVHNSFTYSEDMIPKIIDIKNPYTNLKFSLFNIYNIYFYLMKQGKIPNIFHSYIQENLSKKNTELLHDLKLFIKTLECKYNELSNNNKIQNIHSMIKYMNMNNFLSIPKKKLVIIFGNICKNYYIYINLVMNNFDLEYAIRKYKNRFVLFMNIFWKNNKKYGRIIYKRNNNGIIESYNIQNTLIY